MQKTRETICSIRWLGQPKRGRGGGVDLLGKSFLLATQLPLDVSLPGPGRLGAWGELNTARA